MSEGQFEWSGSNNSTFMVGTERAVTLLGAVRAARHYLRYTLCGEGRIKVYHRGELVRTDERSIHTGYRWKIMVYTPRHLPPMYNSRVIWRR